MQKHIQNGFTLYELLITVTPLVTVLPIILAVGVPNLTDFSRNSRVSGSANDLHGSFLLARSEAARAKQDITICASNNSTAAEPACGGQETARGHVQPAVAHRNREERVARAAR